MCAQVVKELKFVDDSHVCCDTCALSHFMSNCSTASELCEFKKNMYIYKRMLRYRKRTGNKLGYCYT